MKDSVDDYKVNKDFLRGMEKKIETIIHMMHNIITLQQMVVEMALEIKVD